MTSEIILSVEIPDDIKKMKFEEALGVLEDIVRNLESGEVSLELLALKKLPHPLTVS